MKSPGIKRYLWSSSFYSSLCWIILVRDSSNFILSTMSWCQIAYIWVYVTARHSEQGSKFSEIEINDIIEYYHVWYKDMRASSLVMSPTKYWSATKTKLLSVGSCNVNPTNSVGNWIKQWMNMPILSPNNTHSETSINQLYSKLLTAIMVCVFTCHDCINHWCC